MPGKLSPMPNKPRTPHRTVRISDELWEAAQRIAEVRGETVSDEVRAGLTWYVKKYRYLLDE